MASSESSPNMAPSPSSRPTQHDIAIKAGVHRATVSLALKNSPRINAETRERILEIAQELGYEPDPMLSALAFYRTRQRPASFQGVLAWLTNSVLDSQLHHPKFHYNRYFSGAAKRAQFYGYRLEPFNFKRQNLSPRRINAILAARSIQGVLLCPPHKGSIATDFNWNAVSTVTFGYSLPSPDLHMVASAHYRNTQRVMRELYARGYRAPGLVINAAVDRGSGHNIYAAYLVEQNLATPGVSIPPLFHDSEEPDLAMFEGWLGRYGIDALLVPQNNITALLGKIGLKPGVDIGVAGIALTENDAFLAGILERDEEIGMTAVDMLVTILRNGERGVPAVPQRTHIEGRWIEGETLRPVLPLPSASPASPASPAATPRSHAL